MRCSKRTEMGTAEKTRSRLAHSPHATTTNTRKRANLATRRDGVHEVGVECGQQGYAIADMIWINGMSLGVCGCVRVGEGKPQQGLDAHDMKPCTRIRVLSNSLTE